VPVPLATVFTDRRAHRLALYQRRPRIQTKDFEQKIGNRFWGKAALTRRRQISTAACAQFECHGKEQAFYVEKARPFRSGPNNGQ